MEHHSYPQENDSDISNQNYQIINKKIRLLHSAPCNPQKNDDTRMKSSTHTMKPQHSKEEQNGKENMQSRSTSTLSPKTMSSPKSVREAWTPNTNDTSSFIKYNKSGLTPVTTQSVPQLSGRSGLTSVTTQSVHQLSGLSGLTPVTTQSVPQLSGLSRSLTWSTKEYHNWNNHVVTEQLREQYYHRKLRKYNTCLSPRHRHRIKPEFLICSDDNKTNDKETIPGEVNSITIIL